MYSGTTFRVKSGRIMGTHQKIDRVAHRHLQAFLPTGHNFPTTRQILHFEGKNGPDGIKKKSPAVDEPWHFINPNNPDDTQLLDEIDRHIGNLAKALKDNNNSRAAFESAWMAHAITDGLTPAHHFPLEETLKELRNGEGLETRSSILEKGLMKGDTAQEFIRNNWEYWGAKGAMTMHLGFEAGVASAVAYRRFEKGMPRIEDIEFVKERGYRQLFLKYLKEIDSLQMYQNYAKSGWTAKLVRDTTHKLMPIIIRAVVLGWLSSVWRSDKRQLYEN